MQPSIGDKYLITADSYFFAPDGKQYRAVFGTIKGILTSEQALGVKTNARSTNWYVRIGNTILAGCQIHYAVKTEKVNFEDVEEDSWSSEKYTKFERKTQIYNADQ